MASPDLLPAPLAGTRRATAWGSCVGVSGTDADQVMLPLLSAPPAWTGLPMTLQLLPGDAVVAQMQMRHPSLAVARSGRGKRCYTTGRRALDLDASPGMFELYGAGFCVDEARWQGQRGEVVALQLPAAQVGALLQGDGAVLALPTRHELFDARVTDLVLQLWDEASQGGPHGRLYAQGLSLALLGWLTSEHGARTGPPERAQARLSPAQCSTLREYIDAHLASDLSVDDLALLAGLSAAHFARAFKRSFDRSPHAYVTERRIQRACQLLRADPRTPLAQLADQLGFASQSHFTQAFRRVMGVTPGRWRLG